MIANKGLDQARRPVEAGSSASLTSGAAKRRPKLV